MMPQWDFLSFLAAEAARYAGFRLMMGTEAVGLLHEGERVIGVRAREHHGSGDKPDMTFNADLVVACDGRHSTLRKCAGLAVEDLGAPMDVLWFRLSRKPTDTDETGGRFDAGSVFVTLNRGDYWQCASSSPREVSSRRKRRVSMPSARGSERCCHSRRRAHQRSPIGIR